MTARPGAGPAGWRYGSVLEACSRAFAHPDAVDHLQGHKLGRGSRDRYIDVRRALPLEETAASVPRIGEVKDKLVGMARRGAPGR